MAELRRSEEGEWTLHLGEDDHDADRNEAHDEALPRYLTAFDPAFSGAEGACESEFVKALLRIGSMQDAGWDPYETTLVAIPAMIELHARIPAAETPENYAASRHLALWTYGHIVEASAPYAVIADMLDISNGGFFRPYRFPSVPIGRQQGPFGPRRPQFFREKFPELERLAADANMPGVLEPIREVWDYDLRNAVFHADYSLHGGEVRIPGRAYSHAEVDRLVNRAIAYHEALAMLAQGHLRGYREPRQVLVHPDLVAEPNESMTVMVREGEGAIGLRYVPTPEEIAAGAIPAHLARLYPGEVEAVHADPTLVRLPARPN